MASELDLEKIKTIGDCVEIAGGLPDQLQSWDKVQLYAERVCIMGLFMIKSLQVISKKTGFKLSLRVGIHTGKVIAGVIGIWKFKYGVINFLTFRYLVN